MVETPQGNLSKMMQPFQTSYTLYFNRRHRRSGHVFEILSGTTTTVV
jgi:hypothetical protein